VEVVVAAEERRKDDVALAGAEEGEGTGLVSAEDSALEAANAREERTVVAEEGAVTSVVCVDVVGPETEGAMTEVGT
jgi:hypothetical protein